MQVFRSELHASLFRGYIDATREAIGEAALAELLRPYGVCASDFLDSSAWLSLEFVDSFLGAMCERCPDPDHFENASRLSMSRRYLGPLLPLFQAFGTPLFAFRQMSRSAGRMNRLGTWELQVAEPGHVRMLFRANPGVVTSTGKYICRAQLTQLALVPALFDRPEGQVEHTHCVLRDASEQLALALSKLQALDRAKTDFFHNVSHELRSPLTMILAPLEELMAGRQPPGGEAEALKTMHRNTARLLRLINQLLDLGRIDARQIVEEHGGEIHASRSSLGGAQLSVRLPLTAAQSSAGSP